MAAVRAHLASELSPTVNKESYFRDICTSKVTGDQAAAMLEPVRAELERGLTASNGGDPAADESHDSLLRTYLIRELEAAHAAGVPIVPCYSGEHYVRKSILALNAHY